MKTFTTTIRSHHEYQELLKDLESNHRWYYIHVESRNLDADARPLRCVFDFAIVEYQTA